MTYDFLESLYSDIISMCKGIVVKRQDLAIANETVDTIKEYEEYLACVKGDRNIYNYLSLDPNILSKYISPDLIGTCMRDRKQIPSDVLDNVITDMNAYVISKYVEHNEYYRMLTGLPALDDKDYIYIKGYSNIPEDVPIHQMTIDQVAFLESKGVLVNLQAAYPSKRYLHYIGIHRIDLIEAHQAKPFQILKLGKCSNNMVEEMFREEYHKARRYIMIEIYNKYLFVDRPLYEPMMGILILCLGIRNTLVPTEDAYLNFEEILNAILESYGILQYFERLPFIYKKRLVLALDKLYQNKGTDGVLIDICRLFSHDNLTAKRYYLLKTNSVDRDGNLIMSDDPNQKYDLNFLTVDVQDRDIDLTDENFLDYESIVNNDYLWQLNSDELTALKSEEFNLWMSKYISVEAAYDLSQLTYEVCFFINLLLSSRNNTGGIQVNNMYSINGSSDCFTMLIFMLSLMARRAGYDGNIYYDPPHIARLWKFDLEDLSTQLAELIDQYELPDELRYLFFDTSGKYRMNKPVGDVTANDMISVYSVNRDIFDTLQQAMLDTRNYEHYIALSNIKEMLFQSALTEVNFTKSNGNVASTYLDMLEDLDYSLYLKVINTPEEDLDDVLLYVMEKMEYMYSHDILKYLFINTPNTSIALLAKYIRTTIEVFKASSVQLETINIFFYLGTDSPIRVFDELISHKVRGLDDQLNVKDEIVTHKTIVLEDYVRVQDKTYTNVQ